MDRSGRMKDNNKISRVIEKRRTLCDSSKKTKEEEPAKKTDDLYVSPTMCDPLGSYTGVPEDRYDVPVQDVDDL